MPWRLTMLAAVLMLSLLAACGANMSAADGVGTTPTGATQMRVDLTDRSVRPDPGYLVAGDVEVVVRNLTGETHELVILQTGLPPSRLVMRSGRSQVDENRSGVVVGYFPPHELPSGGGASRTVRLMPGEYVLFCNLPDHYRSGMYASFRVE